MNRSSGFLSSPISVNALQLFLMINVKGAIVFILLICLTSSFVAQVPDTGYAREVINRLTSADMHGRGYVNEGDQVAANYIQDVFKKNKLKSFSADYYQSFTFPINTFPGAIDFTISGTNRNTKKRNVFKANPGLNMLIGAGCPGTNDTYQVIVFDSTFTDSDETFKKFKQLIKSAASTFILVDDRNVTDKKKLEYYKKVKTNPFETAGIIEFTKKLTHAVSQQVSTFRTIKLLTDSFQLDVSNLKKLKAVLRVENKFLPAHAANNVIGYVPGKIYPDSFIVFSAHYDHLGQLGKTVFFPGANDNASGCAMLLSLLRFYALPGNQPAYSIAFMAFAGEEAGLVGSTYYTAHPLFPLQSISFLINMDIMGTGDEGITVVNGTLFKTEFEKLKEINADNNFLKEIKIRGKSANSDHHPFSEKAVPAFFIYTLGGIKAYHDVFDKSETLPLTKFQETQQLITRFTTYLQQRFIVMHTR